MNMGIDIVEIDRFKDADESFLRKIFTDKEIDYCESKRKSAQHYATRFAAKEAMKKMMNGEFAINLDFREIEIINDVNGKPRVSISRTPEHGIYGYICKPRISLSHSDNYAVAVAWIG